MAKDTTSQNYPPSPRPGTDLSDVERQMLSAFAAAIGQPAAGQPAFERKATDAERRAVDEFRRLRAELKTNFE